MLLGVILGWGILTMWVPGRWALAVFQIALFAYAAYRIISRRGVSAHPVGVLLAGAALWGLLQLAAGWSVDPQRTEEAVLSWVTNGIAFALALDVLQEVRARERFLNALLWFGACVSVLGVLTALSSPVGRVLWFLDIASDQPTLGPFVYRNQFAAFVEILLPVAIVRAAADRTRWALFTGLSALLFGSVVAAGSRAGAVLCLAEILLVPAMLFARGWLTRRALWRALLGTVAAMVAATAIVGWEFLWQRLQEPNPYSMRRELVVSSLEMIRDRPLTGFGLGAWSSAYPGYAHFDDGRFVNQAHNDWVQWAAEGGVPFFLAMLAVLLWLVRPAWRTGWGVGLLVVFAHCLVDYPMQQRPALAAFFFAIAGSLTAARAVK